MVGFTALNVYLGKKLMMKPEEYKKELQAVVDGKDYEFDVELTCSEDVDFKPDEDMPDEWIMLAWKWKYEGATYGNLCWHCDFDPENIEKHLEVLLHHFENSKDAIKAARKAKRNFKCGH